MNAEDRFVRMLARMIRYRTIATLYMAGTLTKEEASEILTGCLTPGDETTRVDDAPLLDKTYQEVFSSISMSEGFF